MTTFSFGSAARRRRHRGSHRQLRLLRQLPLGAAWAMLVLAAAGCQQPSIVGSGVLLRQQRPVESFHAVSVAGALHVDIQVSPGAESSVSVSGDDNIVPLVETTTHQGFLTIRLSSNGWVQTDEPLQITISAAALDQLDVSGACTVNVAGIEGDQLLTDVSGACTVHLSGQVDQLAVDSSGASTVDGSHLQAQHATVDLSGACSATLRASQSVKGSASGVCTVTLMGPCAAAALDTSGVSKLVHDQDAPPLSYPAEAPEADPSE